VIPSGTPDEQQSDRRRKAMHFLAELGEVVASRAKLQPMIDWVVTKTTGMLRADEGCLRLIETDSDASPTLVRKSQHFAAVTKAWFVHNPLHDSGSWPPAVATSVTGHLLACGSHLATSDLLADDRLPELRGCETHVRALLAVPLLVGKHVTGLLAVTQMDPGRQWTEDDLELLSIVAGNSAEVIEQARLRVEADEKQGLQKEAGGSSRNSTRHATPRCGSCLRNRCGSAPGKSRGGSRRPGRSAGISSITSSSAMSGSAFPSGTSPARACPPRS
jgi:GAF domain-containing protein